MSAHASSSTPSQRACSARLFALGLLVSALACRTSLSAHKDAGQGADARAEDASPDQAQADLAPPDLPIEDAALADVLASDLGSPDLAPITGVPVGFRFDNHTDRTAYVRVESPPVGCQMQTASGWQDCSFFSLSCMSSCAVVPAGQTCCELCDPPRPAVYAIPPGASRSVPWSGGLFTTVAGVCSDCKCQQEVPVRGGDFKASADVYADYQCSPGPCQTSPDGIITMAYLRGSTTSLAVPFSIPYPGDVVVIDITSLPATDAGVSLDSAPVDLAPASDPRPDTFPAAFADVPGGTYRISANATSPDASTGRGYACRPSDNNAVYNLIFSDDGNAVRIVRVDPVQEQMLDGKLGEQSESGLVYSLDAFAGGELRILDDNGSLTARLTIFGSGVPVIGCIESPMTRL